MLPSTIFRFRGGPALVLPLLAVLLLTAVAGAHDHSGGAVDPAAATAGQRQQPHMVPDVAVVDQDGRPLSFYRDLVQGRTVAISFIYTGCSSFCRPVTANLRAVQDRLGSRAGRDIALISVSIDPVTDTPEQLKSFADAFKPAPGWTFVTGGKPEIDRLLTGLGAGVAAPADHTALILIGNDATGTWRWGDALADSGTIAASLLAAAGTPPAESGRAEPGDRDRIAAASARYLPNVELINQDGKAVRLYDDLMKNKVILLDFIYTHCTESCPPLTQNLSRVQDLPGDRVGRSIAMISISVDPAADTPAVLKDYAGKFGARPGWDFLTGPPEHIQTVARKLGGYTTNWQDHNSAVIIGNVPTGDWLKVNGLDSPAEIARIVLQIAGTGG